MTDIRQILKVAETVSEAGKGMDDFVTMNKALQQDGIVTTDQIYRQYRNIMVTEKMENKRLQTRIHSTVT